jgi:hypothetical protein
MSDQTNLGRTNSIINAWFSADCVLLRFSQTLMVLQRLLKENRKEKGRHIPKSDEPDRASGDVGGSGTPLAVSC